MSSTKFYHECITEYIQTEGHVMQLQIHPIHSLSTNQTSQSEFWFKDRHLQEVTQLIKTPLFKRSEAFSSTSNDKSKKDDPLYNILSGNTIRLAYTFKKNPARQYFLVMNKSENDVDGQFHNFHFKNEKMVIFVCQIEKGIENLLKVVNDTKGLTSSSQQQTVSISSYFSQLPSNAGNNFHPSDPVSTSDKNEEALDVPREGTLIKERLKSIVSRVKRLRQKRSRKYERRVERNDKEELSKNTESSSPDTDNGQMELSPQQHSDRLTESNHALNSPNDDWIEDLSFNGASLSDSILSYQSDRFSLDNNSDGSTSSGENLPYYGISDKCSPSSATGSANETFSTGSPSSISNNFEPKSGSLLECTKGSPSKLDTSTHSHPDGVNPSQSENSKGVKAKSRLKRTSKTSRVKELKDESVKHKNSEDGASSSRLGVTSVHDLAPKKIIRIIKESEDYLRKIFEGKTASWRHKMYKTGGPDRRRLNFHCQVGHLSPKQLESIMEGLFNIFCKKHLKYEDYVSKVMLAEAIIKIHMDIYQISHKEAENMLE